MRVRFLMVTCALLTAGTAHAQVGRSMNFAGSLGLNLPIGELDKVGQTGFNVAIRTSFGDPSTPWSYRNSFTFDRFGGRSASGVDNYQYLGLFQWDLVHHTNRQAYQYLGVGYYQFKSTFTSNSGLPPTIGGGGGSHTEGDMGFQGGVGLNLGKSRMFLEIGVVSVLTTGKTSTWFPIRVGVRI